MANWDEVDLENALWTLPENRTKTEIEHRVPLSDAAMEILLELSEKRVSDLVFPGQKRGRPLSDMTLTAILRRWQLQFTQHGFRSSFRDWAGDEKEFDRVGPNLRNHAEMKREPGSDYRDEVERTLGSEGLATMINQNWFVAERKRRA